MESHDKYCNVIPFQEGNSMRSMVNSFHSQAAKNLFFVLLIAIFKKMMI